jgi:hypothetical protein
MMGEIPTKCIVAMTVVSGITYAAVRLSMDLQKGMVSRFLAMPIAPSTILGGHATLSLLSNLFCHACSPHRGGRRLPVTRSSC